MRFLSLASALAASLTVGSRWLRLCGFLAALSFGCGGDDELAFELPVQPNPPAPQPGYGNVHVTTLTSGADLDRDGYVVEVNGPWAYDHPPTAVASNGAVTLRSLTPGGHTLALLGIAANCDGEDSSARRITVAKDSVIAVVFKVVCRANAP